MRQGSEQARMAELPTIPGRLLVRPEEGAELLSLSRSRIYELMASGKIRSIKVGGSRRIPVKEIERFVSDELEAQCL